MKKIILLFALFISSALYKAADAQVHVNINIGDQPVWGPTGYDYVDYYYFPDIDVYYNVPEQEFVYFDGRDWEFANALPAMYGDFDLYRSYKVVINEPTPYLRNNYYQSRYNNYRGMYGRQPIIYNSRDSRYFAIANHPEHERWMQSTRQNNFGNREDFGRMNDAGRWNNNQRVVDRGGDYNNRSFGYNRGGNNERSFETPHSYNNNQRSFSNNNDRRGGNNSGRYGRR